MEPEQILKLREITGYGMLACKEALIKHPDDFEDAIEHIHCDGQAVVRRTGSKKPCGCVVR